MPNSIPPYLDRLPTLKQELETRGSLAVILIDVSPFDAIEGEYGVQTYNLVRQRLFKLLIEQSGNEYRKEDILTIEETGGLRVLLFLSPSRQSPSHSYSSLELLRQRLVSSLLPKIVRTAFPFLKRQPQIDFGSAIGINNPLLNPHHIILRLVRQALDRAKWQRQTDEMDRMHQMRELILNERVNTLYQPIVGIHDQEPMGYEALSRGASGTPFESAPDLFDTAIRHNLVVELDRICRKRALLFYNRLPGNAKIFINTLPATVRDPEFRGQHLVQSLEQAQINPNRIVIEITEKLMIENLSLFQDSMTYYTAMGMSFAVDDVGSGYSGLETIGSLKPNYLKLDMSLVHDVHASTVNRDMLKAIVSLGREIGAKVIAEGIENPAELKTLREIGVDYGQGFLLGRPKMAPSSEK